jgi:hypothetical protein
MDHEILKKLVSEMVIAAAPVAVYESVPNGAAYPYIEMGDYQQMRDDILNSEKNHSILRIYLWSQYRGYSQALEVLSRIKERIHNQSYAITGGVISNVVVQDFQTHKDADNITYNGIMTAHVWWEKVFR